MLYHFCAAFTLQSIHGNLFVSSLGLDFEWSFSDPFRTLQQYEATIFVYAV